MDSHSLLEGALNSHFVEAHENVLGIERSFLRLVPLVENLVDVRTRGILAT